MSLILPISLEKLKSDNEHDLVAYLFHRPRIHGWENVGHTPN